MAQEVEHILGKDEVTSSSLVSSSTKKHDGLSCFFNLCKVCLHKFARFISKIARGACRLRSAIENASRSHRLRLPSAAHKDFLKSIRSLSSALGDREYFVLSSPSLASSSSLNIVCSRRKRRVFLMRAMFFAHICTISLKLCVEPVVCARRLRILRALIASACRHQLYCVINDSMDLSFSF